MSEQPTVEDACDFFDEYQQYSVREIGQIFKTKFPIYELSNFNQVLTLYKALKTVYGAVRKMNRNKNYQARAKLLSSPFVVPTLPRSPPTSSIQQNFAKHLKSVKKENKSLKRKLSEVNEDRATKYNQVKTLEDLYEESLDNINILSNRLQEALVTGKTNEQLQSEIHKLRADYLSATVKIETYENQLQSSKSRGRTDRRNSVKKIKRRDYLNNETKHINELLLERIKILTEKQKQLEATERKLNEHKLERLKLQKKLSYLKTKCRKEASEGRTIVLVQEINDLQRTVSTLKNENKELQELINLMDDPEIITFIDGKYTDEIRQVIMELLSLNVSMNKVDQVIRSVMKHIAHKNVGKLPCLGSRSKLLLEARFLAKVQIAESMLKNSGTANHSGHCLHFDSASKFHKNYQSWQITLLDGQTLTLGLNEMSGGDTKNIVESFNEIVDELAESLGQDKSARVAQLITSIKSTISDQGSVNPCFNKQLQTLREDLLPRAIQNWDTLSKLEKDKLAEMGNFFCKLHLLVNFATECDKTLSSFENVALEKNTGHFISSTESGPGRLVRTAIKAFHPRGSEEAGIASYFKSFLESQNSKLYLIPYVGNRFNVLFYNAAAVYFHRNHIKSFLAMWPNPNKLLLALQDNIGNKVNLAGIRALGIIDKIVTGPFWRMLQKQRSILDANVHLETMRQKFTSWCEDSSALLQGELMFEDTDPEVAIHRDEIFNALFEDTGDTEFDILTQQALELLMHSLLLLLERQAQDHLLEGKYAKPDDVLLHQAQNVPCTNAASERDFAILDLLVRMKPSGTVLLYEALTMWMNNKTSAWLNSKCHEERVLLMKEARQNVHKALGRYHEREKKITDLQ